jgi:hypothetical protein
MGFVVDKSALGQFFLRSSVSHAKHFIDLSTFILVHHRPMLVQ